MRVEVIIERVGVVNKIKRVEGDGERMMDNT